MFELYIQGRCEQGKNQMRTSEPRYNTYYYLYAVMTIAGYWVIVFGYQK